MKKFLTPRLKVDKQYLCAEISSVYTQTRGSQCQILPLLFETFRKIWEGKDIILLRGDNGQIYEYDIFDTAKSVKIILAPRYQAWDKYEELKQDLLSQDINALYILCAGPVSKVLAYDLTLTGRRALDLGHLAKDYNAFRTNSSDPSFFSD